MLHITSPRLMSHMKKSLDYRRRLNMKKLKRITIAALVLIALGAAGTSVSAQEEDLPPANGAPALTE
jgi:hypothetical protein